MRDRHPSAPVHLRRTRFDPAEELRRLADDGPVTRISLGDGIESRAVWLVTGHAEVRQVLGDRVRFSNRERGGAGAPGSGRPVFLSDDMVGQLMGYDPPDHTRLRQMLTPEFTVRRIERLRPAVESIVDVHLAALERTGPPADLVESFAMPVSGAVLCELIGVPRDDRGDFLRRCRTHLEHGRGRQDRASAGTALTRYIAALVARQRRDPDEGFLGALVREHGNRFDDKELRGIGVLLMLAGIENVASMISLGALALLEHPGQLAALRADPAAMDRAVDELLRYLSVPHAPMPRTAVEDVTVGGRLIRAGETLVCSISMANRDPALTPRPDELDLTRAPTTHVAFGHGIHHCLGAALARMELRIVFSALLHRFPRLRLAVQPEELAFAANTRAHGLVHLPIAW